jgi:malate dehydrogenase (oxaloacetate-decarboxylating)
MPESEEQPLYIPYSGPNLLTTPLLNKGSAFNEAERINFNLTGLLPPRYETIDEQASRAYMQFKTYENNLEKHIYLRSIQDNNETLFYRLVRDHIAEMLPIIYTPTVGDACEQFSDIYRSSRGLFISYSERDHLDDILRNATKHKVRVIVVTDGSRILGLGDQGIGGMGIPIGKLSLYTVCGGISPAYTLPITLDVGTNNTKLLNDPMYMGWRHRRIEQDKYDDFLDQFIQATRRRWPDVLIQFEDFSQPNAMPLLKRYRDQICCFNDDIQGTATVTVGTLLAACRVKKRKLSSQNVVFVGAGSAGCGIAEQIISQMTTEGISAEQARSQIYMVDRFGLLTDDMEDLRDFQAVLAQPRTALKHWKCQGQFPDLVEVIAQAKAGILIGVSGQPGLFTQEAIETMVNGDSQPIIFPLSNPSRQVEAHPADVIKWTDAKAIIACGSPYKPVEYNGILYPIAQCNNAYIFPGIGLGILSANIKRVTDAMLLKASEVLAEASRDEIGAQVSLLPPIQNIAKLSKKIAFAIAKIAMTEGHALFLTDDQLTANINRNFWQPEYRKYRRISI